MNGTALPTQFVVEAKDRSPRWLKDVANGATRAYAMASAGRRPLPDFLIVGTKRGGTTSLWNYLLQHPQVLPMFPAPRGLKSNAYFRDNAGHGERWYRSHFHADLYRRRLERGVGRVVTGEANPYYMYGPSAPARIAALMPAVKLIVLLRDPVDRAYGHYQERVKAGTEDLSFGQALEQEPRRLASDLQRMLADPDYYSFAHDHYSYRDRGIYLPQLQRVFSHFDPAQVLILKSEHLYTDTQSAYDQVCNFLDIRSRALVDATQYNFIPRRPIPAEIETELREFYAPHNEALYSFLGRDLGWSRVQAR